MEWIWIGIIVSLVLIELMSLNFTSIFFVISSIISLILFYNNQNYIVQVSTFLIVGLFLIIVIRPKLIDKLENIRNNIIKKMITKCKFTKILFPKEIVQSLNDSDKKEEIVM